MESRPQAKLIVNAQCHLPRQPSEKMFCLLFPLMPGHILLRFVLKQ
uniref:Uncharacterized protein n=1 Tax=Anguilla anguilla TaxID=7936 RepID=A0A0E9PDM7_ANGAN